MIMSHFTREETNLICIYHTGTRADLITELSEMQRYLKQDETELLELTRSVIDKLSDLNDHEFDSIMGELIIDFE